MAAFAILRGVVVDVIDVVDMLKLNNMLLIAIMYRWCIEASRASQSLKSTSDFCLNDVDPYGYDRPSICGYSFTNLDINLYKYV